LKWTFLSSRSAIVFLERLYTQINSGLENMRRGGPSYIKEKYLAVSGGTYHKAAESSPRAQKSAAFFPQTHVCSPYLISHSFKIPFNIILQSTWFITHRFSDLRGFYQPPTCIAYSHLFNNFWQKLEIINLIVVCCTTVSYYAFQTPKSLRFRQNNVSHKYDVHAQNCMSES